MARDRPSPYGEVPFSTVARGPVPRERWIARAMARETRSHARVACEGPSPTMKGGFLLPYCIETRRSLLRLSRASMEPEPETAPENESHQTPVAFALSLSSAHPV